MTPLLARHSPAASPARRAGPAQPSEERRGAFQQRGGGAFRGVEQEAPDSVGLKRRVDGEEPEFGAGRALGVCEALRLDGADDPEMRKEGSLFVFDWQHVTNEGACKATCR